MKNQIVALYVRVSTGHQVDKCSLPFQKKELQNYCKHILHMDGNIEIFEDAGKSAKNTKRPAFERMMQKIKAGLVSHVLVYKIDRISRNLVDFSLMYDSFKYHNVTFISLNEQFDTSSAIGEAVLKIILVFAELERKLTAERVSSIMLDRASQGLWNGARVPYGWDWDDENKSPVHSPSEAEHGRLIYDLYEKTCSSVKVRDYLNTNHIPTKRGGTWTTKTIADFIRNPMNRGDYRYNYREGARGRKKSSEEVIYREGAFPPLVPPEQWDLCNHLMDKNTEMHNRQGMQHTGKNVHVFSGKLICAQCGAYFHAVKKDRRRANGFTPSIYSCGNHFKKNTCQAAGISDVKLGPFVFNYISNIVQASRQRKKIHSPDDLEKILLSGKEFSSIAGISSDGLNAMYQLLTGRQVSTSYTPKLLQAPSSDHTEIDALKHKLEKLERALERLKKAYLFDDDSLSEKEYLETKADLESQKVACDNQLKSLTDTLYMVSADETAFIQSAASFLLTYEMQSDTYIKYSEIAPAIGHETLKDFVNLVIDKIVIQDSRPISITFRNGLEHRFLYG